MRLRALARLAEVVPAAPMPLAPERNGSHPEPVAAISNARMEATLLDVVATKTGYPAEMLQLDMELDTDLGIDSIKRVEIFALLQEKLPDAPPVKAEHLGTLRTLRQVVTFLSAAEKNGVAEHAEANALSDEPRNPSADRAAAVFLEVVSQKTGYPPEMLQLDMELDTDLGIDSIKRVEIFALLQEKLPDAPTVKAEHLGTLRTIRHVVEFIAGPAHRNGTVAANARPVAPAASTPVPALPMKVESDTDRSSTIQRLILTAIELDEQAPREAVSLASNADIWITADDEELAGAVARRLELLGYRARLVTLKELATLVKPTRLDGLLILAPSGKVADSFLSDAFQLLQRASAGLRTAGKSGGAVFATVSRLDGSFGLSGMGGEPVTGGLAGLSKTARHEWPEVHCKALDLADGWDDLDEAAFAIVEELLLSGPVEVGVSPRGRCVLQLAPGAPFADESKPGAPLHKGDIVIVTGGARGVTAETAVALAQTFSPTLVLLGRSPPPSREPAWLLPLTEESEIKRALVTQMNGQATPKDIGERTRTLVANREMLRTIERIEKAGAKVVYRQVDVRDPRAVHAVVAEIRKDLGPIKGLVHGAGVLADRLIEDKTVEQFETVYATKVASLRVLLDALKDDDLSVLALFSSSTGRFGRTGQVDYAVANEVLNKLAQRESRVRPHCRVVAFNWGPWDGGMVNASLKKIFENEGVGLIPLQPGAAFFIREICQPVDRPVEVVVIGELPVGVQASNDRLCAWPSNGR